jgi:PAS domain S-box-containing protein
MVSARVLYIVVVGFSSLLPLMLLRPVLRSRDKPGATGLLIAIPGVSLWSLGLAVNLAATTTLHWFLTANLVLLVTHVSVIGFFLTAVEYAGVTKPTRSIVGILALFPLSMQGLAWTNHIHHLLYPPLSSIPLGDPIQISMGEHPVLAAHTIVSYLLVVAGFGFILQNALSSDGIRRRQGLTLAAGGLLPAVPNVLFIAGVTEFQLTPLGFVGTVFVLAWALFRADFLDVVPVGRTRAVESMDDPVVTLDADGHVVDANPAARDLVDAGTDWEGTLTQEFFEPFPELSDRIERARGETELSLTKEGKRRHFVLNVSPIRGLQDEHRGTLVVLHEFTELKERENDLDLLRQVQSRVLRHNIRNEVGVLIGYSEVFAEKFDDEHGEMAETMVATGEDLISMSNKARSIEKLVENNQTPTVFDLGSMVRNQVERYRDEFPGVTFTLDAPENCTVETIPAIGLALENVIENAAEHNDAADPTVEVTVSVENDAAVVSVSDNGPGIPENELAVLEQREETQLQHGSGVGLWVVDWVVKNSTVTGDFEFTGDGSAVTFHVPMSDETDS